MSKTLMAMLFPFLTLMFKAEGGDGGPTDPQAAEANAAPVPEETAVPDDEKQPEEAKTFTQDEVDAIVQKRIAKLERKMERERVAQQTREQIAQEQAQKPADAPNKPKESDFETYGEYLEALTEYKAREIVRNERAEAEAERSRKAQQSEAERYQARQQELVERGEEKFDDFEEAVKGDKHTYSRAAFLAMLESDMGAELLYYLAKHPEEGQRISNLPAYAQAKEIGKLEDKLQAKPTKQISKAPEPIKPVGTGKASNDNDLSDDLPIDEWMRRRNKQARGK